MFKAPFSFDGRIRRIEYFLSGIVGGIVFSIAWALGIGTFILGAPEFVYTGKSKKLLQIINRKASFGYRVLMLAHSESPIKNDKAPSNNTAIALFVLEDHIREDAKDTIRWFNENGVAEIYRAGILFRWLIGWWKPFYRDTGRRKWHGLYNAPFGKPNVRQHDRAVFQQDSP